ncbi:MAG TPA: hypothetical protein VKG44_03210 [Candidatus Baltobacteraceae bacterium]|nr:hypothetical protein [Candidatus Baltobacteraceae bacterium]
MNREPDDLDRALLALPLEEPPADLRASILAATIYAPPAPSFARTWEIAALGTFLAIGAWLSLALLWNPSFSGQVAGAGGLVAGALAEPNTFGWLATGVAIAFVVSLINRMPRLHFARPGRS